MLSKKPGTPCGSQTKSSVPHADNKVLIRMWRWQNVLERRKALCSRLEIFSFPKSYFAEFPTGTKIFKVEGKFHLVTYKAVGHFTNAMNGEKENFLMHGSFFQCQDGNRK